MAARNKNKQASKFLFYFAIALLVISLAVFFMNVDKFFKITGKAIGTANLTISSVTSINFTTNNINWGTGAVASGQSNATLNTAYNNASNVTKGNWTGNTAGLVIENIGNINVSILIKSGVNAATLLGGNGPEYQYNFSDSAESGSCSFNATTVEGTFYDANTTDRQVCNNLAIDQSTDTLRIDVKLVIPSNSKTGAIGDIVTATATASGL
ncbi:MAG: hypothetical protein Q8N63_01990 [Nanoarchaeota archaeon]|nr:hypothetical protein [Nanoarchaeota archaeon]